MPLPAVTQFVLVRHMRASPLIPVLALFVGVFLIIQGLLGIFAPEVFVAVVRPFQSPPLIYIAAALRIAIGIVFLGLTIIVENP